MGRLARRISRWTTNALLTVMLLVIALGFGRQVLHWWHDDTSPRGAAARGGKGDSPIFADTKIGTVPNGATDAQVLAFGDQNWSIRRREFARPPSAVPAALIQFCLSAIAGASPRGDTADASERDILKRLAAEKPVAEEPGKWRLYQWSGGVPIVIGTRVVPANAERTILAESPYRVVIWGMAVPAAANAWTLYVFQAGGAESGKGDSPIFADTKIGTVPPVPLPPGGKRLASIGSGGSSITAFSADDGLADAVPRFYDRWFGQHGWVAAAPWQHSSTGWQARFEKASGGAVGTVDAVDIRLDSDPQGRCTGLVMESQLERSQ
jgi:hypothetical protein